MPDEVPCLHLQDALATAIGILHGWPGVKGEHLVELAQLTVTSGRPGPKGWPLSKRIDYEGWVGRDTAVRHSLDEGVWLGGVGALDSLPEGVTAVVRLCLVGSRPGVRWRRAHPFPPHRPA